jgi:uncharacterized protein (TIGR03492 family)
VTRVLFVSNGHGEAAIAERIARDLRALLPSAQIDHFALVGDSSSTEMREVGPRRSMPSGGLVAMGNLRNLLRDVRAGLLGLIVRQRRFLRGIRGQYDAAVAVGDAYALTMTLRTRAPAVFVGTAKSVSVAPYGPYERGVLSRAAVRFVRDEPTAQRLRDDGLDVEPGANVIVDLFAPERDARVIAGTQAFAPPIVLLPGSRAGAYAEAGFLLDVVRALLPRYPALGAVLSIANGLDPSQFASDAAHEGWIVGSASNGIPFTLSHDGRVVVVAWRGALSDAFAGAALVLGQAGTANEGAAAQGIPIVAFSGERGASRWYRRRQQGLLGEALAVVPRTLPDAAAAVAALLDDAPRRRAMGDAGRERMGASGASRRIAAAIARIARERACVV